MMTFESYRDSIYKCTNIKPELLRWARESARLDVADILHRFPHLEAWEDGTAYPTLKQLEDFAKATHAPVGYLFLDKPPVEKVPIPDFRTVANERIEHPSPDLLDTLYLCQQRQEWYRDFARSEGDEPLAYVGSTPITDNVIATASKIRSLLGFDIRERSSLSTWTDALRLFIRQVESIGILVMVNGVVQNNTHRHLDPAEFRGFALVDTLAPLVFINGADTKAAQMFTLAHEVAHIWLGQSALSDTNLLNTSNNVTERWCNEVAAELLVPLTMIQNEYRREATLTDELSRIARIFKVSTLVVLRRIYDTGDLTWEQYRHEYESELDRIRKVRKSSGGGQFYLTQAARLSRRFASALVVSTLQGETLHRDAFRMLGFSKHDTFMQLGRTLGVVA